MCHLRVLPRIFSRTHRVSAGETTERGQTLFLFQQNVSPLGNRFLELRADFRDHTCLKLFHTTSADRSNVSHDE